MAGPRCTTSTPDNTLKRHEPLANRASGKSAALRGIAGTTWPYVFIVRLICAWPSVSITTLGILVGTVMTARWRLRRDGWTCG